MHPNRIKCAWIQTDNVENRKLKCFLFPHQNQCLPLASKWYMLIENDGRIHVWCSLGAFGGLELNVVYFDVYFHISVLATMEKILDLPSPQIIRIHFYVVVTYTTVYECKSLNWITLNWIRDTWVRIIFHRHGTARFPKTSNLISTEKIEWVYRY